MKRLYQIEIHITNRECRGASAIGGCQGVWGCPGQILLSCEEPGDEAILEANGETGDEIASPSSEGSQ